MAGSEQPSDRQSRNQFRFRMILLLVVILSILLLARSCDPPSPPPEVSPSVTLEPTSTTTEQAPTWQRPVVLLVDYSTEPAPISPGIEFTLELSLINKGQTPARNIILTILTDEFIPLQAGGVLTIGLLASGEEQNLYQQMVASDSLLSSRIATLVLKANYTDTKGKAFEETFNLGLILNLPTSSPTPSPTTTPTVITPTITKEPDPPTPTFTPSPTVTRPACTEYGKDHGTYWIVAGCDALSRISQVTGISLDDLLAENPEIKDPDLIYPGQVIKFPKR